MGNKEIELGAVCVKGKDSTGANVNRIESDVFFDDRTRQYTLRVQGIELKKRALEGGGFYFTKGFSLGGGLYFRQRLTEPKARFSRKELERQAADPACAALRDRAIAEWEGAGLIAREAAAQ